MAIQKSVLTRPLYDLLPGFAIRKVVRALPPFEIMVRVGHLFSLYSGSSAILSHGRSGESCHSKDQRETLLTSSIEVNQTYENVEEFKNLRSPELKQDPGWERDPERVGQEPNWDLD